VIDVGPANTAGRLIDSLLSIGLDRVDYFLITHIHIDHAGGLTDLLEHYPMAKAICHEKAVDYIVDPSKLWAGSLKVLGKVAEAYGQPKPVQKERLIPHTKTDIKGLKIIETPGHAIHHLSFSYKNRLFVGEAGGNYLVIDNTEYLRPATPPRFFFDVSVKSVDRLFALENQPICYAHFGRAESSQRLLRIFRDQLIRWKEIIYELVTGGIRSDEENIRNCIEVLLEKDPNLAAFNKMDKDTQERERFLMANAVKGFLGFLRENEKPATQ
jgi:glyoxylase-like metal-dependent hydrolase (beta-lactamase superfamily II)